MQRRIVGNNYDAALTTRPTPKQKTTPKAKAAAYQSVNPFNGKILTNIKPSNPTYREEFFGPVALFFRVKNEDEAVALANDSDFDLGSSVFTADVATRQARRESH